MSEEQQDILPVERARATSPGMIWLTVLIVLLSGVVLNGSIRLLLAARPGLDNPTYGAFHEQWNRLVFLDEPVETLILGDSSCRHGVDPEVLDVELGTRSLNFCSLGNAAVINSAWQLETYIERHGAPRRVILIQVHDVWKRNMQLPLIARIPLAWGFWERLRASWSLSPDQMKEVFLSLHIPVYSQDKTVTELLKYPWRLRDRRLWFTPRGFSPIEKANPRRAARDAASHLNRTVRGGWRLSDQNRLAIGAMMDMADDLGFDLYIGNSPQLEGMLSNPKFGRYYEKGQRALRELVDASPRTHLILSPPAEYGPGQMENSDHIAAEVVPDFTRRIAADVAARESHREP